MITYRKQKYYIRYELENYVVIDRANNGWFYRYSKSDYDVAEDENNIILIRR